MKTILRSTELSCPSCIVKIEKSLKAVPGVSEATVHFTTGRIDVEHDDAKAPVEKLLQAVRAVGYDVRSSPV